MDLNPSEEEVAAAQAFGSMLDRSCPLSRVREAEPLGFDADLWSAMVELGVMELAIPKPVGEGVGLAVLGVIAEQVGRNLAPVPLAEAIAGARLLGRLSDDRLQSITTEIGKGAVVAIASTDLANGESYVPAGAVASSIIGQVGPELRMWSLADHRLPLVENLGSMPLASVTLADLNGFESSVIASGSEVSRCLADARTDWQVLTAHALYGAGSRALEIGLAYVMEREQFERKVASFQAVQHRFADAATELRGAQLLAYKSAWAVDQTDDGPRLAALALLCAGREAFRAASEALHFHGGYGFTLEYDIQLFFRRTRAWPLAQESFAKTVADVAVLVKAAAEHGAASDGHREGDDGLH